MPRDLGTEGLVKWEPELGPQATAYMEELHAQIAPRIGLMVRLRKALGMTQIEAARALEVTQGAVSKQERTHLQGLAAISAMARSRGGRVVLRIEMADGRTIDLSDAIEFVDPAPILETTGGILP